MASTESFDRWLRRAIGVMVGLLALIPLAMLVALVDLRRVVDERERVDGGAISAVDEVREGLIDQQTAARRYVITEGADVLETFENGGERAATAIAEIEARADHVDGVAEQLRELTGAVAVWRAVVDREIDLVRAGDREAAVASVASGEANDRFMAVRAALTELDETLDDWVAGLDRRLERRDYLLVGLAIATLLAGLALAAFLLAGVRRSVTQPLQALTAAAGDVSTGAVDRELPRGGFAEVSLLAAETDAMRRALLQGREAAMLRAEQVERERLADALHDDPVQSLFAVQLRLERLTAQLDDAAAQEVRDVLASIASVQRRLRSLMFELHPGTLVDDGLEVAVRDLAESLFGGTSTTVTVDVAPGLGLDHNRSSLVFRLTAEALRNAARHADAGTVAVTVRSEGDGVLGEVVDDGRGLPPEPPRAPGHRGVHIAGMLAKGAGGRWAMEPAFPSGTRVEFWLPC